MDTLLEIAIWLFIVGQALGILLAIVMGVGMAIYAIIHTLRAIHYKG